jgi:serine/threonine-protein kinase
MNDELARLWPRAERVLDEVLDLPEPERSARAVEACAGDSGLEAAVRRLLVADRESRDFLDGLPPRLFDDADDVAPSGPDDEGGVPIDRIGPFRVVRDLGSGGMGVVLLGERDDGEFEQRVAIKLLHRGFANEETREVLVRERRILARLEHPDIARMYDGGVTASGEPYFVMEYVDGTPIDVHCDGARLSVDARVRLVARVCRAVEYAHGRLVVHCDLKPRNVLVTPSGDVRLVDFGIARLLGEDAAESARPELRGLTPAYAAPEQRRGEELTVATDVFQLGLVLYELLTGRRSRGGDHTSHAPIVPASDAADGAESESREIAARRGTTPRSLARQLAGDLDAILARALSEDPALRYESVETMRRDLEAYLGRRPVSVRTSTPGDRVSRYVSRHRWGVVAASAVAASVVAGTLGIASQSRVAAAERDRARFAERRASAINDFLLAELLRAPMPEASLGRALTVAEVLANADRSVDHAFADEPLLEAEVRLALARTYAALGHVDEADRHARSAHALLSVAPGAPAASLEESERTLAEIAFDSGRHAEARQALASLYERQLLQPGPTHPPTLRTAAALGRVLVGVEELAAAEELLRSSLSVVEREHPSEWRLTIDVERQLVRVLSLRHEAVEAERIARRMLARLERHLGPDHPDRIATLTLLANTLIAQLRYVDAVSVTEEALAASRRVFGDEHPATSEAWYANALALDRLGRHDRARAALGEALAVRLAISGPDHPRSLFLRFGEAVLARSAGELDRAEATLREVIEARARVLGEPHPDTIRTLTALISLLAGRGREAEAREVALRAIGAYEAAVASPDADPSLLDQYAVFLLEVRPADLQDPARSLELAQRAVARTGRRSYPPLASVGDALARLGRVPEAIAAMREALDLPDGIRSWSTEERVVQLLLDHGTPQEIDAFLRERIMKQRTAGAQERMVAKTLRLLAHNHERAGRNEEAEPAFREAAAILRRELPPDSWELGRVLSELGGCIAARGAWAEAEPLLLDGHAILVADRRSKALEAVARERIVELYGAWGRPADAERWREGAGQR